MSVKVLLLKSGEDIIADVQEMVSPEDKVMGYFLTKPCTVKVKTTDPSPNDDSESKPGTTIAMFPWMPLAKEQVIPLALDWVVTMVTPQDKIHDMYIEDVLKNFKEDDQTDSIDESTEVGLTD
jgi:hypothetical protein